MDKLKNKIPIIAGILFLLANIFAVLSAWMSDNHRYDFGISFSAYVGLSHMTSVVWFVIAVFIIVMLIYYLVKTKMSVIKKIVYSVVLLCIFGTAFFPYNFFSEAPTPITINLHNYFAICLMLLTTVSFILSAIFSKSKKQRVVSLMSIVYAVAFIVLYFIRFQSGIAGLRHRVVCQIAHVSQSRQHPVHRAYRHAGNLSDLPLGHIAAAAFQTSENIKFLAA